MTKVDKCQSKPVSRYAGESHTNQRISRRNKDADCGDAAAHAKNTLDRIINSPRTKKHRTEECALHCGDLGMLSRVRMRVRCQYYLAGVEEKDLCRIFPIVVVIVFYGNNQKQR